MQLKTNIQYIVTKPSNDGTFRVGDHIKLLSDGAILCKEAMGWIDKDDVPVAIEGMEFEINKEWANKGKEQARKLLEILDDIEVEE